MGGICSSVVDVEAPSELMKIAQIRFIEAAAAGNVEQMEMLLEQGVDVNASDTAGRGALHLACSEGHCRAVKFLLSNGAKLEMQDRWGKTPLVEAVLSGKRAVADLLVHAGAVLQHDVKAEMEAKMHHFSARGDLLGVQRLLESGIGINTTDYNGRTALHIACEWGKLEMVNYLIAEGADVHCLDVLQETPMTIALKHDRPDIQDSLKRAAAMSPRCQP